MYISINRYGDFKVHATSAEAVQHCLESLNGDYADAYWASDDGQELIRGDRADNLDFTLRYYDSAGDALADQISLDAESLPYRLRALADAIESAIESGIE